MITGFVQGQVLRLSAPVVAADTLDYLTAQFVFRSADWNGMEKWAHFAKGGTVYDVRLTEDKIRREDHLNLGAGEWKVYIHGNRFAEGKVVERITTAEDVLCVVPTGALNGEPFPEMPASVTEQILARLEDVEQNGGGSGGQQAQIDDTLTKPGYAADAKAVGEKINQLSGEIADKLDANKLPEAINTALAQAKESGEFDGEPGAPGTTPHIGENGNWWIGNADTGVKAQGKDGKPGEDYVLTEADKNEIAEVAAELVDIPDGGSLEQVADITLAETVASVNIPFEKKLKHLLVAVYPPAGITSNMYVYVGTHQSDLYNVENLQNEDLITDINVLENGSDQGNIRVMCKIDILGGLVFAYWGVVSRNFKSTNFKFLNQPLKCDGLSRIIIKSIVAGFELQAGSVVKIWGCE